MFVDYSAFLLSWTAYLLDYLYDKGDKKIKKLRGRNVGRDAGIKITV